MCLNETCDLKLSFIETHNNTLTDNNTLVVESNGFIINFIEDQMQITGNNSTINVPSNLLDQDLIDNFHSKIKTIINLP